MQALTLPPSLLLLRPVLTATVVQTTSAETEIFYLNLSMRTNQPYANNNGRTTTTPEEPEPKNNPSIPAEESISQFGV